MHERLKILRKKLDLTQQAFATKLGLKQNTIACYELNRTEPSNPVITLICHEFNVNEKWLRTGEGEMFLELPAEDEYFKAATSLSDDPLVVSALVGYYKLNPDERDIVMRYVSSIVHDMDKQVSVSDTSNDDPFSDVPYDPDEFDKKYFPNKSNRKNGNTG